MRGKQESMVPAKGLTMPSRAARAVMDLKASDRALVGGWCAIASPLVMEVMARAGYDWLCVDMQHGRVDDCRVEDLVRAGDIWATPVLVRVQVNAEHHIGRVLDAGAAGVIVPLVNSAEDAARAAEWCRYPPAGSRSWGPLRAALGHAAYSPQMANEEVTCLVMVETVSAIESLDEIVNVPGVDGVFVGPYDLSLSVRGSVEQAGNRDQEAALISAAIDICKRNGTPVGIACSSAADAKRRAGEGFQLLAISSDLALLGGAAATSVMASRSAGAISEEVTPLSPRRADVEFGL
jgi:4-hydroxy-2-oxoheptanedioate aldolase